MDVEVPSGGLAAGSEARPDRRASITRLIDGLTPLLPRDSPALPLVLPLALLVGRHLRFDAADPRWPDRDRLVLAPSILCLGEAAASLLAAPVSRADADPGLADFAQSAGSPLGAAVGLALAERMLAARFGRSLVDHRTWVLESGEEGATGAVQEAAWLAGAWRLGRLTLIRTVAAADLGELAGFAANGWSVRRARAGDAGGIAAALSAALRAMRPTLIAVLTQDGPPVVGGRLALAGNGRAEAPEDSVAAWQMAGRRASAIRRAWLKRLSRHAGRPEFEQAMAGRLPAGWHGRLAARAPGEALGATAACARDVLSELAGALPCLAAMPGTAGWKLPASQAEPATGRDERAGRLAQGIGAALCGMARHGGVLPWAAGRLRDADGLREGLREAASQQLQLIRILVEPDEPCAAAGQRASLRAMRNLHVFRPADATEALECLELALRRREGPSVLLLSEAPAPTLADRTLRTRSGRGGYVVAEPCGGRAATLIASGADLQVAEQARALLTQAGLATALVSLPCWDLFALQAVEWREAMLGDAPRIGVESGSGFGWERWIGAGGLFVDCGLAGPAAGRGDRLVLAARQVARAVLRHLGKPAI